MEKKIFIFKYALTKGIIEVDAEIGDDNRFAKVKDWIGFLYLGVDYFYAEDEALKKAEDMRLRKIKSLEKQIDKLKKLKFKKHE